jgi:hypothetical protein
MLDVVLANAEASDCTVERDKEAGTAIVTDAEGDECLRAIQPHYNGGWITTFYNTSQVQWNWPKESKT